MAWVRLTQHFVPARLTTLFILLWVNSLIIFPVAFGNNVTIPSSTKPPVRLRVVVRNVTRLTTAKPVENSLPGTASPFTLKIKPIPLNSEQVASDTRTVLENIDKSPSEAIFRRAKSIQPPAKISGVDKRGRQPEEFIRNALINHTLEHGGEQDLDKLVFSSLPQGSKLILRTVRIIRTDENGDPVDDAEDTQPTYWDVTLANATDSVIDDEEEEDADGEEDESEEEEVAEKQSETQITAKLIDAGKVASNKNVTGKKKSDLESSGSHSAAKYHQVNDYGTTGRDKEHGKINYHGNTHGKTHKQTYTETDGKDVKPYQGTEAGQTDYANAHDGHNKNQGERFKTSKRKNKGRKVSGFKRVYHKEEFQRTEHFFDDEEANKIAESFGLSEKKEASEHGTKGDKRKYHGVRTDYLDGKENKDEKGTHDGYDKGQHNIYRDTEKHSHQSNYGKGGSQQYGNSHQNGNHNSYQYHNHQSQDHHPQHTSTVQHHPNHNYHVTSYSTPDKTQLPKSVSDHIGYTDGARFHHTYRHRKPAIVHAPVATSFSVTEYSPLLVNSATSSDPAVMAALTDTVQKYPVTRFRPLPGNSSSGHKNIKDETLVSSYDDRRVTSSSGRLRKEPREKKVFFSPKHRVVSDGAVGVSSAHASPHSSSPINSEDGYENYINDNSDGTNAVREMDKLTPIAPNFSIVRNNAPLPMLTHPGMLLSPLDYKQPLGIRYPKSWRWPRRRLKRPRPGQAPTVDMQRAQEVSPYRLNQMHLAGIPLRHATAYNRLGNRFRYQLPPPRNPNYMEMSTRKSDVGEPEFNYLGKGKNNSEADDAAHYLNHNHRYAKNYQTSTIHPPNYGYNSVRNTLLDPEPGVYSTLIKVLPATMLNVNESSRQGYHTITASGSAVSATRRPLSAAESISITTPYPPHLRPFLPMPKNRPWISFNLNLGNPDNQQSGEGGQGYRPHSHPTGKRVTNFMQGIRNGILNPFARGHASAQPPPPPGIAASPSTASTSSSGQTIQLQKLPTMHLPPAHYRRRHPFSRFNIFGRNSPPSPPHAQFPPPGNLPPGSKDLGHAVLPPRPIPPHGGRPKFYYNHYYKPANSENSTSSTTTDAHEESTTSIADTSGGPLTATTNSTGTTVAAGSSLEGPGRRKPPPQSPNFMNGLMDSVAGFFGRMG